MKTYTWSHFRHELDDWEDYGCFKHSMPKWYGMLEKTLIVLMWLIVLFALFCVVYDVYTGVMPV